MTKLIAMREPETMSLQEEQAPDHYPALDMHSEEFSSENKNPTEEPSFAISEDQHDAHDESSHEEPQGQHDSQADKRPSKKDASQAQFEEFLKQFQSESQLELKLQLAIDFMEKSLSQEGTPHFRHFWEARKLCLPLFKENISPLLRSQLWNKYSELSKEARRLKEILDEQGAFAVEQIEIAVKALEEDIVRLSEEASKHPLPADLIFPQALESKRSIYEGLQQQLTVLNVQASRINALRKELLKTEMRIRQKNKFFQRLSQAGDQVFPRRKDLIKQLSQQFMDDVAQFIQTHFKQEFMGEAVFVLREEIKGLQSLAKVLTLNTNAFTQTRLQLSECWDELKVAEKERKKERQQHRLSLKQNAQHIQDDIEKLKNNWTQGEISIADAQKEIERLGYIMRKTDLDRFDIKVLKDSIHEVRQGIQEKLKADEDVKQQQEQERNRQRKEKYREFQERAEKLSQEPERYDADQLQMERDTLVQDLQSASLSKNEKQEIERLLKPIKDLITEKKEQLLLNLSADDRQALEQLKELLQQRKQRRQEIKSQLEAFRKAAGSSSLDFEKAMQYKEQIQEEKERLEKINHGIEEIEQKLSQLQSKVKKS